MPFDSQTYRVLIASPSDLSEERQAAREVILEWNVLHASAESVVLLPVMWETHMTPTSGVRPQSAINDQIVLDADILIGMFWTKLGSNTGVAASGTVEEIDQFAAARKPALLYFSSRPIDPSTIDTTQLQHLREFKSEMYARALVGGFASINGMPCHANWAPVRRRTTAFKSGSGPASSPWCEQRTLRTSTSWSAPTGNGKRSTESLPQLSKSDGLSARVAANEALAPRIDGGLGPVLKVELTEDIADMTLDRLLPDTKCLGDLQV